MAKINKNFKKLETNYLFVEVTKRMEMFRNKYPDVSVIRLGIGDTTQPLSSKVIRSLRRGVDKLSKKETYSGYGFEQGTERLRTALSDYYQKFSVELDPKEIFISDGAKTDISNIQSLFSLSNSIAVQDPIYPVYVDSNIISGRNNIVYIPCTAENNFIPKPPDRKVDVIYLCSPNNPTGTVMTKEQLSMFIAYARRYKAIIIFDSAYSMFIKDKNLPRSIYEIEGAKSCAIEISSFSKWAGFTGVRLGWTIVPTDLVAENATKGELNRMWLRRQTTMFNGASNIAQEGGLGVLSRDGQKECQKIIDYYMKNAKLIKNTLSEIGFTTWGGDNGPYIWLKVPNNLDSWEFFDKLLKEAHVVGTPGVGFGPGGEGYVRLSAFGDREDIKKAVNSIRRNIRI